jgi:hypothetical protein
MSCICGIEVVPQAASDGVVDEGVGVRVGFGLGVDVAVGATVGVGDGVVVGVGDFTLGLIVGPDVDVGVLVRLGVGTVWLLGLVQADSERNATDTTSVGRSTAIRVV